MKKLPKVEGQFFHQKLYSAMITVDEASKITMVESGRLTELCNLGFAPCLWIDGNGPFFKRDEIIKWTKENLVRLQAPKPLSMDLKVIVSEPADPREIPVSIAQMSGLLRQFPWREAASAIYFLVLGSEIVYVGQSTTLGSRLATHSQSKEFDKVFYLPIPRASLLDVESALIRALRPKLNQTCHRDPTDDDLKIIESFCISKSATELTQ